nr:MAG TPA: hypothetical protein [Caudoviricetes sp.]DAL52182.1 MAG TPA_asm: hypothetical protein [Caudoviricetes sp.]
MGRSMLYRFLFSTGYVLTGESSEDRCFLQV